MVIPWNAASFAEYISKADPCRNALEADKLDPALAGTAVVRLVPPLARASRPIYNVI